MEHRGTFAVFAYLDLWYENNFTTFWKAIDCILLVTPEEVIIMDIFFSLETNKQNQNDKFSQRTSAQKRLPELFQKSIKSWWKNSILFMNTIDNPIKKYSTNNLRLLALFISRFLLNSWSTCHNTHTNIKRKQKSGIWTETSVTCFK